MAGYTSIRFGKAKVEFRGFEELMRNLNYVGEDVNKAAFEVFELGTLRVYDKSQARVPVYHGDLKASGRRSKPRISKRSGLGGWRGGIITASVNYGGGPLKRLAPNEPEIYGLVVHEDPSGRGYKFLEIPMVEERANVMHELEKRTAAKLKTRRVKV